jgi:hypothetical protein
MLKFTFSKYPSSSFFKKKNFEEIDKGDESHIGNKMN